MVKRESLANEFLELVRTDSISLNERAMADLLKKKLSVMGYDVYEDDAGKETGGNTGNLICHIKGNKNIPGILLMAHMDTVMPGLGKKPIVNGDIIKSDGRTVLGGDDASGIVSILEAVRILREDKTEHGDIFVVFTIAEEIGLIGAKHLNIDNINAAYAFVLDGEGSAGGAAVRAPSHNSINVVIKGKSAHAGLEPEKGISAIEIASNAISRMKLGRIDFETTANIGKINGGNATNIVCDRLEIKAEARSRDEKKLDAQTKHMRECFEQAASKYGGSIEFNVNLEYPAYSIDENDEIISVLRKAANNAGIELKLQSTGGGSDTNIINGRGIKAIDLSVGMAGVHDVEEHININDMIKTVEFVVEIIKAVQ